MTVISLFSHHTPNAIYHDLDGYHADFYGCAEKLLGKSYRETPPAEAWAVLDQVPHLFRDLDPLEDGQKVWRALQGCKLHQEVLTALPWPTGHLVTADDDKRHWTARHLSPSLPFIAVASGTAKALYAAPGRVLIDDLPRNIHAWVAAGGIGVLHVNADDTLEQLARLGIRLNDSLSKTS